MVDQQPLPHKIAVAANPGMPEAQVEAERVVAFLRERGVERIYSLELEQEKNRNGFHPGDIDLLIALGGDGTMLRAGHLCAPLGTPILGINLGHFGFLMEVQRDQWRTMLPLALEGQYRLEPRMMLHAEHFRSGVSLGSWDVVNEVVVCRGQFVKPIRLNARVENSFVAHYVADGLIVSTPTGSTAYALAAGGPIMPPELRNILMVPVAPHLTMNRAIILSEGASVTITVDTNHEAVLSVDGKLPISILHDDEITVGAGEHTIQFMRFHDPGYFYRNLTRCMDQTP